VVPRSAQGGSLVEVRNEGSTQRTHGWPWCEPKRWKPLGNWFLTKERVSSVESKRRNEHASLQTGERKRTPYLNLLFLFREFALVLVSTFDLLGVEFEVTHGESVDWWNMNTGSLSHRKLSILLSITSQVLKIFGHLLEKSDVVKVVLVIFVNNSGWEDENFECSQAQTLFYLDDLGKMKSVMVS